MIFNDISSKSEAIPLRKRYARMTTNSQSPYAMYV